MNFEYSLTVIPELSLLYAVGEEKHYFEQLES